MKRLNRFPKMAVLQKERAVKLGFGTEFAKAIGFAEAKKYAIFSRRGGDYTSRKKSKNNKSYISSNSLQEFRLTLDNSGFPIVANQTITSKDYDDYMRRFDLSTLQALEAWAQKLLEKTPSEVLRNETRFFNNVWKLHRDDNILA